jgi:hypothetical protein
MTLSPAPPDSPVFTTAQRRRAFERWTAPARSFLHAEVRARHPTLWGGSIEEALDRLGMTGTPTELRLLIATANGYQPTLQWMSRRLYLTPYAGGYLASPAGAVIAVEGSGPKGELWIVGWPQVQMVVACASPACGPEIVGSYLDGNLAQIEARAVVQRYLDEVSAELPGGLLPLAALVEQLDGETPRGCPPRPLWAPQGATAGGSRARGGEGARGYRRTLTHARLSRLLSRPLGPAPSRRRAPGPRAGAGGAALQGPREALCSLARPREGAALVALRGRGRGEPWAPRRQSRARGQNP